MLDKRHFGGNVALKVDIKKAFDTLDLNFLIAVLKKFGFSYVFTDWILAILHSARLSILVNGKAMWFFSCSRGVRQGILYLRFSFVLRKRFLAEPFPWRAMRG